MKDTRFTKFLLIVNGLVPLALMLWDVYFKRVGANPLEFVTRTTGMLTLVFLMVTLAISPVRYTTRLNWLVKFRRLLGLFAFFYGFLHLATYIAFDRFLRLTTVPGDIVQRPFIAIGMLAFFLMLPLALTSTNSMAKRLGGKRWSRLHKLVYVSAIAGVIHFWLLVKSDIRVPLTFGFILALLLGHRLLVKFYPTESAASGSGLLGQGSQMYLNPERCQKVAGGRSEAKTSGMVVDSDCTQKGCQRSRQLDHSSGSPSGCRHSIELSDGLPPPATILQPSG